MYLCLAECSVDNVFKTFNYLSLIYGYSILNNSKISNDAIHNWMYSIHQIATNHVYNRELRVHVFNQIALNNTSVKKCRRISRFMQ